MVSSKERDILRNLAEKVAHIAGKPEQEEKRRLWKKLNDLEPERPMTWITEVPWNEFDHKVDELSLQCENEQARHIEQNLRRTLFTARHFVIDQVIEGIWEVPKTIRGAGYGLKVEEDVIEQGDSHIQSHGFKPVIKDFEDIEKIQMPDVQLDSETTQQNLDFFRDLFGDILQVRAVGRRNHWFNAWDTLVRWTGVTESLTDLMMRPDFIHACMRRITDSYIARMAQLQDQGLLDYPYPLARVGSGASGYSDELPQPDADPAHIRTIDQWGGATAQIFSEVSPEMHEEFALQYENEVMERCGLNYYGCCEPLHNKMQVLAKVSRLRKISISPRCDTAEATANAEQKYVFSHKPTPACMAEETFNEERAEEDIRSRLRRSGDMPCEITLKDISTAKGDVNRLISWCEIASRIACKG